MTNKEFQFTFQIAVISSKKLQVSSAFFYFCLGILSALGLWAQDN